MRKIILLVVFMCFIVTFNAAIYGDEYKKTEIKYGMHERTVNKTYGKPLLVEKIKGVIFSKKKALYTIDESTYLIVHFLFERVSKITILEDMRLQEVKSIFAQQ